MQEAHKHASLLQHTWQQAAAHLEHAVRTQHAALAALVMRVQSTSTTHNHAVVRMQHHVQMLAQRIQHHDTAAQQRAIAAATEEASRAHAAELSRVQELLTAARASWEADKAQWNAEQTQWKQTKEELQGEVQHWRQQHDALQVAGKEKMRRVEEAHSMEVSGLKSALAMAQGHAGELEQQCRYGGDGGMERKRVCVEW